MVTDAQVRKLFREMTMKNNVTKAALRADMDRTTASRYIGLGKLPSELRNPRSWRTRVDPFADVWSEIEQQLDIAPELEAKLLFENLQGKHPDRFHDGQVRTFQRRVRQWRALNGPPKEVFFAQQHRPGEAMQTDFTWATQLGITIKGVPFIHMLCHPVLPYSNWEWATVCRSESMPALKRGVQSALLRLGHIPQYHQTDNSTAATHEIAPGERKFNRDYMNFVEHFGMMPRTIAVGESHQNGDVEALNNVLKNRLRQHLLLRGTAEFDSVEAYECWIWSILERANALRAERFNEDIKAMKPLAASVLPEFATETAKVTSWSTIQVMRNTYSVPSRLISEKVKVRIYEDHIEVFFADQRQLVAERLLGRGGHKINYRHVIWSLVKKPGAFSRYRYRDDMYPTLTFRRAYDAISEAKQGIPADLEYLRVLHLAATTMEYSIAPFSSSVFTTCATVERFWPMTT